MLRKKPLLAKTGTILYTIEALMDTNTNAMGSFALSLRAPKGRGNLLRLLRRFTPRNDTLLNAFVLVILIAGSILKLLFLPISRPELVRLLVLMAY